MERHELTVTAEAAGCRLDKGLALLAPELSRSQIQTLAEKGSILKNGAVAGKKDTLREGDSIIISLPGTRYPPEPRPRISRWRSYMRTMICW